MGPKGRTELRYICTINVSYGFACETVQKISGLHLEMEEGHSQRQSLGT